MSKKLMNPTRKDTKRSILRQIHITVNVENERQREIFESNRENRLITHKSS